MKSEKLQRACATKRRAEAQTPPAAEALPACVVPISACVAIEQAFERGLFDLVKRKALTPVTDADVRWISNAGALFAVWRLRSAKRGEGLLFGPVLTPELAMDRLAFTAYCARMLPRLAETYGLGDVDVVDGSQQIDADGLRYRYVGEVLHYVP